MIERLLLAIAISAIGVLVYLFYNRYWLARLARSTVGDPLLAGIAPDSPVIVYFTTPACQPCRTIQKPALTQLQAEMGAALHVIQIDASEQPDIADRWGVFSAPTTFVFSQAAQKPRHINRGPVGVETLKAQLAG